MVGDAPGGSVSLAVGARHAQVRSVPRRGTNLEIVQEEARGRVGAAVPGNRKPEFRIRARGHAEGGQGDGGGPPPSALIRQMNAFGTPCPMGVVLAEDLESGPGGVR